MPEKKEKKMHTLAGGNWHIRIREKMLEFSTTVLPAPSPYCQYCIAEKIKYKGRLAAQQALNDER